MCQVVYPPSRETAGLAHIRSARFSIFPLEKGANLSPHVARAIRIMRDSGLPYSLGAVGTGIEGEWE
jgi:uncharacterized protein YqgV (UPF0045/DUF77 family)